MKTLLLVLCAFVSTQILQAETAEAILNRMDQSAPAFRGMTAEVEMTNYTAIISDKTVEMGTLKIQRQKNKGVRAIIDFSGQSDAREIAFLGNIIRIFYPNLKLYQDYDVGKNSDVLNQFLLLGFGSSGKELAENYQVTTAGSEKIAGQETTKLLLIPKGEKLRERLDKIEMWIPEGLAYPVEQQFYEPSGNYRKVGYHKIKLNPAMSGTLELKLPPGTKKRSS